ncbi:DUF6246 family protein [bacterium]|nr:DUF6246 family protein [bacterium]
MTCEIGHFKISAGGIDYNLTPSFKNILKLGSPTELVGLFSSAHEIFNPAKSHDKLDYMSAVMNSAFVIRTCCDIDPTKILVDVMRTDKGLKLHYNSTRGAMTPERQLMIAAGLLRHGVAGVKKESESSKGDAADSVDIWEFVHTAMVHLNMSKEDALSLTMTEFVRIFDKKYPPEKTAADSISDADYDEAMARLKIINAKRDVH